MDAAALPARAAVAAPGSLRLHLELRWRDTVLVARSFTHGVWSGPTKYHPFPMEGFECDPEGFVLASRDGDSYLIHAPNGSTPARPRRLSEGQACEYARGELTLKAWVTREQQVLTLDWLWPVCFPFALLLAWRMLEWCGIVFAFVLMLIPKAPPPALTLQAPEPARLVKVLPMVREVKPPPLPEKPADRLKLLMEGRRSSDIFKDAARRAEARQREDQRKAMLRELVAVRGTLKILGAREEPAGLIGVMMKSDDNAAVFGALTGNEVGESFGAGGLGLSGVGTVGTLGSSREKNPAEEKARELARTSAHQCWNEEDDDTQVVVRLTIAADGSATPVVVSKSAPARLVACLEQELRGWKLPATADGGHVTLRFRHP